MNAPHKSYWCALPGLPPHRRIAIAGRRRRAEETLARLRAGHAHPEAIAEAALRVRALSGQTE